MKREVVRDFLNLPGIAGVALMDGRSRPYFCGVDQTLNFQQKEALVQGITQVVETTPDDFDSFEFQFTGHQVYIYKLEEGMVLLVLTRSDLNQGDYLPAIDRLKAALKEDVFKAVTTFRLIASDLTMSNQNYWKNRVATGTETVSNSVDIGATTAPPSPLNGGKRPPPVNLDVVEKLETPAASPPVSPPMVAPVVAPAVTIQPDVTPASATDDFQAAWDEAVSSAETTPAETAALSAETNRVAVQVEIKELLVALNQLSQFTTQYLGTAVITNYWKSSRPRDDWLQVFQIDRSAKLACSGVASNQVLDDTQLKLVQDWVAAFIKRCSQVIRDFPTLVNQSALTDRQKLILL